MTRIATRSCLLLAAVLLLAAPAHAFRLIGAQDSDGTYCAGALLDCDDEGPFTRWFQPVIPFRVNQDAASDAVNSSLDQTSIIDAAKLAYQAWEDVPDSFLKFVYDGETSARIAADGQNTLVVYDSSQDSSSCVGSMGTEGSLLGVTILTEDLPTGEITDADVVMDSAEAWVISTDCDDFDFLTVLTHEYGHSVGIHHSEVSAPVSTRPSMTAFYFCDAGTASGRTLEPDDEAALQCLYPENPAIVLMDETGSMSIDNRMDDAQDMANAFIADFGDNTMGVASFAQGSSAVCPPTGRDGYNLREDWTDLVAPLQDAINATSPCGATPMWESICCGMGKASELDPANLLVITDTEENVSGAPCSADCPSGFCGCVDVTGALDTAAGTETTVYVIDVTQYSGTLDEAAAALSGPFGVDDEEPRGTCSETGAPCDVDEDCRQGETCLIVPDCNQKFPTSEGQELKQLTDQTGGIYCSAFGPQELEDARLAIERHMMEKGKAKQNPPTCLPTEERQLADDIQEYLPDGAPNSPFLDREVFLEGWIAVKPGVLREAWPQGELVTYLQDCSGGIQLLDETLPELRVGTEVQVQGRVATNGNEIVVSPAEVKEVGEVEIPGIPVIRPQDAALFEMVGELVSVQGFAEEKPQDGRFELVDEIKSQNPQRITVFIDPNTGIDPGIIAPGQAYQVTGLVAHPERENLLLPRSRGDIVETFGTSPSSLPGEPERIRASWNELTQRIDVRYSPGCATTNHTIFLGPLEQVSSYGYQEARCYLGTSGETSFDPGQLRNIFFLMAGENGLDESSYGRDSSGQERPEDVFSPPCDRPQGLGAACR
jgi:hypothetical protein